MKVNMFSPKIKVGQYNIKMVVYRENFNDL